MSKYSKFGVDNLSIFCVMSYIKVFAHNDDDNNNNNELAITTALPFLWNRQAKN